MPSGQIDVEPRTKTDHAEALTGAYGVAAAYEADNPPGNKTGDLHYRDARAGGRNNQ